MHEMHFVFENINFTMYFHSTYSKTVLLVRYSGGIPPHLLFLSWGTYCRVVNVVMGYSAPIQIHMKVDKCSWQMPLF